MFRLPDPLGTPVVVDDGKPARESSSRCSRRRIAPLIQQSRPSRGIHSKSTQTLSTEAYEVMPKHNSVSLNSHGRMAIPRCHPAPATRTWISLGALPRA